MENCLGLQIWAFFFPLYKTTSSNKKFDTSQINIVLERIFP